MYRYVFKRVKETIEFGVNVRKSFACQQALKNEEKVQSNDCHQNKQNSVLKYQEINFLVPQHKRVEYEDFKKKYNCKHPNNCNPFLQAITWSTALIAGFYASQLICLYRRNHQFDPKKCFYARYLHQKSKLIHRRFLHAKQVKTQERTLIPVSFNFTCPFKNNSNKQKSDDKSSGSNDEFKEFVDEFTRLNLFDKRFKAEPGTSNGRYFYHVNNDTTTTFSESKEPTCTETTDIQPQSEDEAIESIMSNLSEMIGELEFQNGVECILHGDFEQAVEHFRMSSSANNASACFNLGLLYEQGLGVKKDLRIAMKLYQLASEQGHDKAQYNLGVYFARGLGGAKKSFKKAKSYFKEAARHGNNDAMEALSLLLPAKKKLSNMLLAPDDFIVADDIGSNVLMTKSVSNHYKNMQIAVT